MPLTLALAQLPPVTTLNSEFAGNWSLVATLVVAPKVPPGWLAESLTASMMVRVTGAVLLAALLSLVALVVPVNVTETGVVSVPPAVPGVT